MKKLQISILTISLTAAMSASAQIYTGTDLSGLTYVGNPGDAQYVAGTPDVAQLYTPDSGTADTADSPAVFVLGPLGTLSAFSASYDLYSSSGGNGNSPYWNIAVSPDANPADVIEIISMGGSPLTSSSTIHAYGPDWSGLPDNGYWGYTLSELDAITYDGYTIGDMTVNYAGVEIGDWNISDSISATAEFDSITVVPEPATMTMIAGAFLLPFSLRMLRKTRTS